METQVAIIPVRMSSESWRLRENAGQYCRYCQNIVTKMRIQIIVTTSFRITQQ